MNKVANLIGNLNFYKFMPYLMDKRGPPNRPHIHLTKGHLRLEEQNKMPTSHSLARKEVLHTT